MENIRDIKGNINTYNRLYNSEEESSNGGCYDFLNDTVIWESLCAYLLECAEEYINKVAEDNTINQMQKYLAGTYSQLCSGSFMDVIQVVEDFLCKNANNSMMEGLKNG